MEVIAKRKLESIHKPFEWSYGCGEEHEFHKIMSLKV